jgi:6-phospho-beta-glucosidase
MSVKLAVVGAGSTYTPELVEGLARRAKRLTIDELAMLDLDETRLEIVGGLAARMLAKAGWPGRLVLTADRDRALEGAAFVIVQLRVGGNQARLLDETIPLKHGCIGQETTGPGGFMKALRTVPVVLELAEAAARRGADDAWIVDFTNPTGIVTQALLDAGHRAVGLCNAAINVQREMAQVFHVEPGRVRLDHVGLNHLTWVRKVLVDGVDRLPEVVDAISGDGDPDLRVRASELGVGSGHPPELIRLLRAIPSSYLRYYYATDRVLQEQLEGHVRAQEVIEIEAGLLDLYRDPSLDTKPELLERRGGAYYSEAAAMLVASLHDGAADVQVANVRNAGSIPNLGDEDVVEISSRVDRGGAHPLPTEPLGPEMLGLVQQAKAYERLAIDAAGTGSRARALEALMANPLVRQYELAEALLADLLEANRAHLPRFFPTA